MSKVNSDKSKTNLVLAAAAVLLLVGVIVYAWNITPSERTSKSSDNQAALDQLKPGDPAKLGENEVRITTENFEQEVIKSELPILVDVYSPACQYCQKVAPILTELSDEYKGKFRIGKMDVTVPANRDFVLKTDNSFQYVPAYWIYVGGELKEKDGGAKTKEQFVEMISKYVK